MKAINYKRVFCFLLLCILSLGLSLGISALNSHELDNNSVNLHSSWTFAGLASNEDKQVYYYYFQLGFNESMTSVQVLLVDAINKRQIRYFLKQKKSKTQDLSHWEVGRAFLRFNAINNSYVFGLKNKASQGFNFRVELLNSTEQDDNEKELSKGIRLKVVNPKQMNGHIRWGKSSQEEFVTADVNVYRDLSKEAHSPLTAALEGVFCFLNDGNRFYSVQLHDEKAKSASQTQWITPQGEARLVSQFIQIEHLQDTHTQLGLEIPKTQLTIDDTLLQPEGRPHLRAGCAFNKNKIVGFCYFDNVDFKPHS